VNGISKQNKTLCSGGKTNLTEQNDYFIKDATLDGTSELKFSKTILNPNFAPGFDLP